MTYYQAPMQAGEYTTSSTQSGDLGKTYRLAAGVFRWVTNDAAITNAGGKLLSHVFLAGAITGHVIECATASDYDLAGVVTIGTSGEGGAILLTTTIPINSYFLAQVSGGSRVQAANTTVTLGAPLIATSTSGGVASLVTTVDAAAAVLGYLGYATNTVAATAAGQLITCVLTRVA
jgi:hypothetical protein